MFYVNNNDSLRDDLYEFTVEVVTNRTVTVNETVKKVIEACSITYDPDNWTNLFEFWISGVFLNIIGLFGIIGNIISMIILSRPQMRSSINYLLMGLAKCDIILILTSMLLFGLPTIYPYTGYLFYYYYYIHPNISPVVYTIACSAQTASVYLTLTVTLERFVAVCHPLRARALCTYGRAKIYFIVIIIFGFLYNIPRFWEVSVVKHFYKEYGTVYCVFVSELRKDRNYIKIYIQWLYLVFIYFLPFISLALLNTLIYKQVRKANRERARLSRMEKREIGLATMLLCVVFVFFLCNVLALVINILEASFDIIQDELVKVSNLLVTINSSVNFIIYVIFGEKFKRIFLTIFCTGRMGRESPDGMMHDDSSYSNGDGNRSSGRFQRIGTLRSSTRNGGTSVRISRSIRVRAPSPGPCVYYPARESNGNRCSVPAPVTATTPTLTTIIHSNSIHSSDWEREHIGSNGNGMVTSTSGF